VRVGYVDSNRGMLLHTVNRVLDTLGSMGIELDELLSASLLNADVGKAYLLLSRAVDRHK
jgi:hypothetical protein